MKRVKPQKRGNIITPENYLQFKPSEFVHSFISDIEVAEKMGKPMDMHDYDAERAGNGRITCLPCMGGMSILNWGYSGIPEGDSPEEMAAYYTARLGDGIRCGLGAVVAKYIKRLYGGRTPRLIDTATTVRGIVRSPWQFKELKDQVLFYTGELEKQGL